MAAAGEAPADSAQVRLLVGAPYFRLYLRFLELQ